MSERLEALETKDQTISFLRSRQHTIYFSNEFRRSIGQISRDKQQKVVNLIFRVVADELNSVKLKHITRLAAGSLTRVSSLIDRNQVFLALCNLLETRLNDMEDCTLVLLAELLSYIATIRGSHGAFVKHIEQTINDRKWRGFEYDERLRYCGSYMNIANNISAHLKDRRSLEQILCHDVGRLIEIYPKLIRRGDHALARRPKSEVLEALIIAEVPRLVPVHKRQAFEII